jgi:putative cardiolipin synthase
VDTILGPQRRPEQYAFTGCLQCNVRVRILTNSLEASTAVLPQSAYMPYRIPMLETGVELYEIRSLLGNARGSGQTAAISRYGNYSLHAKLFVFDRQKLFVGSMNFDQRSSPIRGLPASQSSLWRITPEQL